MNTPEPATYSRDGLATNLPAASLDALEFLRCWQRLGGTALKHQDREALDRCITALEAMIAPHLPFQFLAPPDAATTDEETTG